mmetsp:Transcript_40915/g.46978  ORF Transcript_40915/g.46978 Transcript_40915/m.46978 type:complete len:199 (-) Transcript_40915:1629-2225(-)
MSLASFTKMCKEALRAKLASISEQKRVNGIEIPSKNDLDPDWLNFKARAEELVSTVLASPPKLIQGMSEPSKDSVQLFVKMFEAYKEFILTLLSFDCSYLLKVVQFLLNEALQQLTLSVSDCISLKIGGEARFESIEDIQKRARHLLRGCKGKEPTQITNPKDEEFLLELFKTHPNAQEKGMFDADSSMKVFKGLSEK